MGLIDNLDALLGEAFVGQIVKYKPLSPMIGIGMLCSLEHSQKGTYRSLFGTY